MPENISQTEETSNQVKKVITQTIGKVFKLIFGIILIISILLILLVSFLKIIFKIDTADSAKLEKEKFVTYTIV